MSILAAICLLSGLYSVTMSLWVEPYNNIPSKLLFKILPFFLGLANLFAAGKLFGWF